MLSGIPRLVRQGWFAVDVFIIISGFVIFYLLDNKKESYARFIARRFFRLWPLFILLFLIGIPTSLVSLSNLTGFSEIYPSVLVGDGTAVEKIESWWSHIFLHIGLHLPMSHGIVPDAVVPYAPSAFLGPAWSISLEWQFYLIAPFVFSLAVMRRGFVIPMICIVFVVIFVGSRKLPEVQFGAFLPMHIEYFFIGGLSYFAFKWSHSKSIPICLTPLAVSLGAFLFITTGRNPTVLPIVLWLIFFFLLIDIQIDRKEFYIRTIAWFFDNKLVLWLGKISYSVYLSHALVIVLCQSVLIRFFPELSRIMHLVVLAMSVGIITILVSHFLFVLVERPGMMLGKRVANSLNARKLSMPESRRKRFR